MVQYEDLGFRSFDEYIKYFMDNLVSTNKTYNYFVDWDKVRSNVKRYVVEISILNALTKVSSVDERKALLRNILLCYPQVIPVIPYIIAVREKSLTILEISNGLLYKYFDFSSENLSKDKIEDLVLFSEKTGILELMGEISDLYTYLIGVEVGLDTNARKNRSGSIFQELVGVILRRELNDNDILIKEEVVIKSLGVDIRRKDKRVDFVIYYKNEPLMVVECSFYNVTGSKPQEVAEAYVELNKLLREKNIGFVWITDGPAWKDMKEPFIQAVEEIDYVLNLHMTKNFIRKIINTELSRKRGKNNNL